jgi:heme a synthase
MREPTPVPPHNAHAVRVWLLCVAAMIFLTLVVGGATRLTESGLSITEWKPVIGIVPPLSHSAWEAEFKAYQAIPQYKELNRGMSLAQYKHIYWWEWTHRLLARSVGMVFLLPFLFFLWRGWVPPRLKARLWTLFGAGALLGAVGWWMVSSGLAGSGRVSVSQYRLAFHLTLAAAIFAGVLWTAQQIAYRRPVQAPARLRVGALAIAALVLLQIYLGALVAGSHAGWVYNSWPLIDGSFIPSVGQLFHDVPAWRNFFENRLTVQFDHRMVAYTIWLIAVLHAYDAWRARREARGAILLAVLVTLQAALGIFTVLHGPPVSFPFAYHSLALAHQMTAIVVFTIAIMHAERLWHRVDLTAPRPAALRAAA